MTRDQRTVRIAIAALGLLVGVALGIGAGIWLAAPSVTDLRNACTAELTVTHAGLPPSPVPTPATPGHRGSAPGNP